MKPFEEVAEREAWGRRCGDEMAERKAPGDGSGAGPDGRGRGRGTEARSRAEEAGDGGAQPKKSTGRAARNKRLSHILAARRPSQPRRVAPTRSPLETPPSRASANPRVPNFVPALQVRFGWPEILHCLQLQIYTFSHYAVAGRHLINGEDQHGCMDVSTFISDMSRGCCLVVDADAKGAVQLWGQ